MCLSRVLLCFVFSTYSFAAELPSALPEKMGLSSERLEQINRVISKNIAAGNIQGAITAVARGDHVVHFETHGLMDVEKNIPMQRDAIFIMMSSTKPILGVAAMIAIEEGWFRPQDPISRYIPELANMSVAVLEEPRDKNISPESVRRTEIPEYRLVPSDREVTIHDILTHTSGIMSGGLGSAISKRSPRETLKQFIPSLGNAILDFQPGTRWKYSPGTALDVIARIIEITSGKSYDEFIKQRIFIPLDMVDTHYNLPTSKETRRVVISGRDMSRFRNSNNTYFSGSYGLSSTARDYLRFEQMLANGGKLGKNRILSPRTVDIFSSNQVGDLYSHRRKGMGFGYTVAVTEDSIISGGRRSKGAFGWGGAFGTRSWTDPAEDLSAVLMLQQPHGRTQYEFENAIRQAIIE